MTWVVFTILAVLAFLSPRLVITVLVYSFFGWLLCDIDVDKTYSWYAGIWHGLFFVANYIRHLCFDTPFKAELYTTAYNVFYWIFSIISTLSFLFGGTYRRRY